MSLRVEDALFKLPSSLHRVLSIGVSLLTEDDASGDEDTNRIPSQSDACRGGLYTRLSSVVPWQRNEYGLFTRSTRWRRVRSWDCTPGIGME